MPEQDLDEIMRRLPVATTKLLLDQFGKMSASEVVGYMLEHPEDEGVQEYLLKHISPEFAGQVTAEFERRHEEYVAETTPHHAYDYE